MRARLSAFLLSVGVGLVAPACSFLTGVERCELDERCGAADRCVSGSCVARTDAIDDDDAGTSADDAGAAADDAGALAVDAASEPRPGDLDASDGGAPAPADDAGDFTRLDDGRADAGFDADAGADPGGALDDGRADGGALVGSGLALDAGVDEDGRPLE